MLDKLPTFFLCRGKDDKIKKMKLKIENIGLVQSASVELNSLTVLCGENDTGKSTIGKTLFSSLICCSDAEKHFFVDVQRKASGSVDRIVFSFFSFLSQDKSLFKNSNSFGQYVRYRRLFQGIVSKYSSHFDPTQLINEEKKMLERVCTALCGNRPSEKTKELVVRGKEMAFLEFDQLANSFYSRDYLIQYKKQFIESEFETEFFGNFFPVGVKNCVSKVSLSSEKNEFSCVFRNGIIGKEDGAYVQSSAPFSSRTFYIEDAEATVNAFLLQRFPNRRDYFTSDLTLDFGIASKDELLSWKKGDVNIEFHSDKLVSEMTAAKNNILEKATNRDQILPLIKRINEIYDVSYIKKKDKYFLKKTGLDLRSQPTGSKLFFLLSFLLSSGLLDSESVLIFDEPEVHLHPEWQNKLAEVLVLLQKMVGAKIFLTTHSPHFVLAIDTFERKYNIRESCKFYYGKKIGNASSFSDYSSNINPIFTELFSPFVYIEGEHETLIDKKG